MRLFTWDHFYLAISQRGGLLKMEWHFGNFL